MTKRSGCTWLWLIALAVAALIIYKAATRTVDFPVYYYTARTLLQGRGPLYGPESGLGLGSPTSFRYPLLFLLLFVPFALLPMKVSAAIWAGLKFVALYFVARAMSRRLGFPPSPAWWLVPLFLVGGFLVQEFRFGNVQFLVAALVAAALLQLRHRPWLAAFLLALAVNLKVWPVFFLPYLAARRRLGAALLCPVLILALALLPALYFGWQGNLDLVRQWAHFEWATGRQPGAFWYPGQSLRGVLDRYLTAIDYSKLPDKNYRSMNLLSLDPRVVSRIWLVLDALGYLGLLVVARRSPESAGWTEDSIAFCALALLEPNTHRISLIVLLWPAIVAGTALARGGSLPPWARSLLWIAVAVFALEPLIPEAQVQRLFQVLGVDFFAICFLTTGLLGVWIRTADEAFVRERPV